MKRSLFPILLAFLFVGITSAQESCPKPPEGKTAWFDTCKYLFIGNGVKAAHVVEFKDPSYTDAARRQKLTGQVIVAVALNAQGVVDEVKVARSLDPGLDQASIEAVKRWKFDPATKDGKPVAVQFEVETWYRLY